MNICVYRSLLDGHGVFAEEPIQKSEWQYVYGYVAPNIPGDPHAHYAFEYAKGFMFVPYAPWCYLNHSNTPNCEVTNEGSAGWLVITALRDIEFTEEITLDYGYGYDPSDC